jgi:hypothetical protein
VPAIQHALEPSAEVTLGSPTPVPTTAEPPTKFAHATACVRDACTKHGLDEEHLLALLSGRPELRRAVACTFGDVTSVPTRHEMERLVAHVEDALDLAEPLPVDLASPLRLALRACRAATAGCILLLSMWIVIGAIVSGQNEMAASTSPAMTAAMLVVALVVLGLLEAAHIGVVALSTADVSALESSHPRVFGLHRFINTKDKLEQYLSARQLGVVLIVFVIAEVTRTAGVEQLPGTSVALPAVVEPLLRVGAPGALLVLVIAQVAPQLLTARRPAALMNLAPMAAAFKLTRGIGHLGLARPASWLVSWSKATERIPSAPRERYNAETIDVAGFGVLVTRRQVDVGRHRTITTTETTIAVFDDDRSQLASSSASVPTSPVQLTMHASLLRGDDRLPVVTDSLEESRADDRKGIRLRSLIAPRLGTFEAGDVLDVSTTATFDCELVEDYVVIDQPTKLVVLRVTLEHPPAPLPPALLTTTRDLEDVPYAIETVKPRLSEDGTTVELVAVVTYPDTGSTIRLRWDSNKEAN